MRPLTLTIAAIISLFITCTTGAQLTNAAPSSDARPAAAAAVQPPEAMGPQPAAAPFPEVPASPTLDLRQTRATVIVHLSTLLDREGYGSLRSAAERIARIDNAIRVIDEFIAKLATDRSGAATDAAAPVNKSVSQPTSPAETAGGTPATTAPASQPPASTSTSTPAAAFTESHSAPALPTTAPAAPATPPTTRTPCPCCGRS